MKLLGHLMWLKYHESEGGLRWECPIVVYRFKGHWNQNCSSFSSSFLLSSAGRLLVFH